MIHLPFLIDGKHQLPILGDITYTESNKSIPISIFCHVYKGFKDWGCWHLVAQKFASKGFAFVKFNFSHNGGTVDQPIDFPDLKAFGNNNYIKELDDLQTVIDWLYTSNSPITPNGGIHLIGHSRGGGIVTIKGAEENRIMSITSWAGVSDFSIHFPKGIKKLIWKIRGVGYVYNVRTKQRMPHYYQFYKNFKSNQQRLTISNAVQKIDIPHLLIHGTNDLVVPLKEAQNVAKWNPKSELFILNDGDHSFHATHPWKTESLPVDMSKAIEKTMVFLDQFRP